MLIFVNNYFFIFILRRINLTKIPYFDKILITIIVLLSILFWNSAIIYPIKLFVVLLHEISHGLIAILTGGKVESIEINYHLGGSCSINGGNHIFIAFAGYLGSLIWGALLFMFSFEKSKLKYFSTFLALLLLYFSANYISGVNGVIFTLLFIIVLILLPRFLSFQINKIIFSSIGLISCLYVLTDIKEDIFVSEFRITDAQLLSETLGLSPFFWGFLWLIISAIVIYFIVKKKLLKII